MAVPGSFCRRNIVFREMRGAFVGLVLGNGLMLTLNPSSLLLLQRVKYTIFPSTSLHLGKNIPFSRLGQV